MAAVILATASVTLAAPAFAAEQTEPAPTTDTSSDCEAPTALLGSNTYAKVPANTDQLIVVRGAAAKSAANTVEFWSRQDGCWSMLKAVTGRNGNAGWSTHPRDGSGLSPIGVYSLTDAGGRLPDPGSLLPYDLGPETYASGGYRMNSQKVQVFDYVVAVNFNRYIGSPPRDDRRPIRTIPDGGIWLHVNGTGPTRGCVSVTRSNMKWLLRWLDPQKTPHIVMGPSTRLSR